MIELRRARAEDREQIVQRCAELFGPVPAATIDRLWQWQWDLDPRLDRPGMRGNVAESEGTIIGHVSFIPAGLHIHGQPVDASWATAILVHQGLLRKAMRADRGARREAGPDRTSNDDRRGWASRLLTFQREEAIVLGKHVAMNMLEETRKTGYRFLEGTGNWFRRLSLTPAVRGIVGGWIAPLVAAVPNAVAMRLPRAQGRVTVMEGDFDSRFDELWDHARLAYPAITRRDARVLQWRYRQRPDASYTVHTLCDGPSLRGYAVIRLFPAGRRLRGKIVDLLTRFDDDDARRDLLAASLRTLRAMGADKALCYATHDTQIQALRSTGFATHRHPDPVTARNLPDVRPYFTEGDGDGS